MTNRMPRHGSALVLAMLGACGAFTGTTQAAVDLFFVPTLVSGPAACYKTLEIEFRARSSTASSQAFSALSVILEWDPAHLELLGNVNNTAPEYIWLNQQFPNDQDMINPDWSDGDALYTATGQLFTPPSAPPNNTNGMLVTKFRFKLLGASASTVLSMNPSQGTFGRTKVVGTTGGSDVTGDISSTTTFHIPAACDCALGDVNGDGAYGYDDIDAAVQVLLGLDTDPAHVNAVDANCDSVADGLDIQPFMDFMLSAITT